MPSLIFICPKEKRRENGIQCAEAPRVGKRPWSGGQGTEGSFCVRVLQDLDDVDVSSKSFDVESTIRGTVK